MGDNMKNYSITIDETELEKIKKTYKFFNLSYFVRQCIKKALFDRDFFECVYYGEK